MKKLKDILEFVSKDTIYEKLDINNVNLKSNSKLDLSYDKIIELLEYKKFKQKPYEIRPFIYDDVAAFNDYNVATGLTYYYKIKKIFQKTIHYLILNGKVTRLKL